MAPHSGSDASSPRPSYLNNTNNNPQSHHDINLQPFVQGPIPSKSHGHASPHLPASDLSSEFDLVCVGFGPASLAVAVALHDSLASNSNNTFSHSTSAATTTTAAAGSNSSDDGLYPPPPRSPQQQPPKVLFIEKQASFAWHAGMLLPGAKMQISFVKDLATLRDPRSEFTFLNYLHRQGRLVDFTNLGTFLPARVEYEQYMRWCASFFDHLVQYGKQVVSVSPEESSATGLTSSGISPVSMFTVQAKDVETGETQTFRTKNVLLATGGQPSMPKAFPVKHPRVIHSSQYAHLVPQILPRKQESYRVAVVGAGQSAAEIFHNIQNLYPNVQTRLIMRQEFLRPSDDSPL